jgi:hypothetical protein
MGMSYLKGVFYGRDEGGYYFQYHEISSTSYMQAINLSTAVEERCCS